MRAARLKYLFDEVDTRAPIDGCLPLLAVSIHRGVEEAPPEVTGGESNYKVCQAGDLVINRMRAFQGSLGIASVAGLVSPDYAVLRALPGVSAPFLSYLLRSRWGVGAMAARIRGIGGTESGNVRTPRVNVADLGEIAVDIPDLKVQREIVDFLERECARIAELQTQMDDYRQLLGGPAVARFAELTADLPRGRVGYRFEVQLGKMLDEKRIDSADLSPYLRNTNVQWDCLELGDLKEMTFSPEERQKYLLRPGDLLVCEGGQPGRAAVWRGELEGCYFQKALMRVRPRGSDSSRFLMWALRLASVRGDFAADSTGSAIQHLPAERLIATQVPMCDLGRQLAIVNEVDQAADHSRTMDAEVGAMRAALDEYRDALITEAVTGELPVAA